MDEYAASLPPRRRGEERSKATPLEHREIPSRRGDDALMVDQGTFGNRGTVLIGANGKRPNESDHLLS